ncbi:MAG: hypothetical protein QOH93_1616, partial [Chloroflexia bacterium]|nr:hypothetical protein [Chloroflexia bacterium]
MITGPTPARRHWLRVIFTCVFLCILFSLPAGGNASVTGGLTAYASPNSQDKGPDLCALLPSGPGFEVVPSSAANGKYDGCYVGDHRRGDEHKFFYVSISKQSSAAAAHAEVKRLEDDPTTLGKWEPTTQFGDKGFAYKVDAVPPSDPNNPGNTQASAKVKFARGPYIVSGDSGWKDDANYTLNDPGEMLSIMSSVDEALSAYAAPEGLDLTIDHVEVVQ